jgi:DHA2 family multidrug resistance protein
MGKVDLRLLISAGFLVFAACMYTRTWFSPDMDMGFVMIPQFAQGLANALFFTPLMALAFSALKPEQMAGAAGLFNCVRMLFGAIGASVVTTLWERREALHHTRLTEFVNPYNPTAWDRLELLQRLGMDELGSAGYLTGQITRQGFILSANEIYYACTLAFLALIAIVWLAKPVKTAKRT